MGFSVVYGAKVLRIAALNEKSTDLCTLNVAQPELDRISVQSQHMEKHLISSVDILSPVAQSCISTGHLWLSRNSFDMDERKTTLIANCGTGLQTNTPVCMLSPETQ